jgi:hypothetical protein
MSLCFEGRYPGFQILYLDRFDGCLEDRLGRTHSGTGRGLGVLYNAAQSLDGFPCGTLHLGDGVLHHGTAGFSVGRLEGLLLEPAPEGDISKTTLRRGLGNRCTGNQYRNNLVLFATEFFAMSDHLRSPAIIWGAEPATGIVKKSILLPMDGGTIACWATHV